MNDNIIYSDRSFIRDQVDDFISARIRSGVGYAMPPSSRTPFSEIHAQVTISDGYNETITLHLPLTSPRPEKGEESYKKSLESLNNIIEVLTDLRDHVEDMQEEIKKVNRDNLSKT